MLDLLNQMEFGQPAKMPYNTHAHTSNQQQYANEILIGPTVVDSVVYAHINPVEAVNLDNNRNRFGLEHVN